MCEFVVQQKSSSNPKNDTVPFHSDLTKEQAKMLILQAKTEKGKEIVIKKNQEKYKVMYVFIQSMCEI
jgi:hypothetical protein